LPGLKPRGPRLEHRRNRMPAARAMASGASSRLSTAVLASVAALAALAVCCQRSESGSSFATYAPRREGPLPTLAHGAAHAEDAALRRSAGRISGSPAAAISTGAIIAFGAASLLRAAQTLAAGSSRTARRPRPQGTALRALTEIGTVKLNLPAGKATPAPPVGPALGQFGANIAFFVKEYNAMTADKAGNIIPVVVHVMSDRSFTLELKTPPTAALIHKAVGKDRGSGKAGTDIIGKIDVDKLREIAELKLSDLNCADVTRAMKIIHGTCVASGVEVEGYNEWLASVFPKPASILRRYGPGKINLPAPFNE